MSRDHTQRSQTPLPRGAVHRAVPPTAVRSNTRTQVSRTSLADLQSDVPANNSTGMPKTPTGIGISSAEEDNQEERGLGGALNSMFGCGPDDPGCNG